MRAIMIAAVMLVLDTGTVFATSGITFLKLCQKYEALKVVGAIVSSRDAFDAGHCSGYIYAVTDGSLDLCPPDGVTDDRLRAIVISYMKEHSAELNTPATVVIKRSLRKAWPCN